MTQLHFHVERIKSPHNLLLSWLPLDNFLTPSVRPSVRSAFLTGFRFMHKAPTHANGSLMTGPYADTSTATSNYFKYAGEGPSWGDLWEGERGVERQRERGL